MKKENVEKPEKKKKPLSHKKKEILFATISFGGSFIVTLFIILTFAVFIPQANMNKADKEYRDAVSLLDNGNYKEAASRFKEMSYNDSQNLYHVAEAGQCFEAGDYESGINRIHEAGGSADVRYDANGGTVSNTRETISAKRKWINSTPTRNGYDFIEWNLSSFSLSYTANKYVANLKLLAAWNIVNYSITYNLNGGSLSDPVSTYNVETPTFSLGSPVKKGYTFTGWSGTDINGTSLDASIKVGSTGDRVYTANYEPNQYTITYDYNYGTNGDQQTVTYDADFTLIELNRNGYRFDGWFYNNQKFEEGKWTIDSDITLLARWSILTYFINYDLDGGTNDPLNPNTIHFFDEVILRDPIKNGYQFEGWYLNGVKVVKIPEGTTEDIDLVAKWSPLINELTISSEDTNKGTVSLQSGTGYSGEEIVVNATPKESYSFLGWYNGETLLSSSLEYTFTMPASDYSLVARFIDTSAIDLATSPNISMTNQSFTYGLYPQTHVNDVSLIASLEKASVNYTLANNWVKYNNQYYAKSQSLGDGGYFDDGTPFVAGSTYWFKCEPIEWVAYNDAIESRVYFTSKNLLDVQYFDKEDVIYENSSIRAWLNTDFYNSAFMLNNDYIQESEIKTLLENVWIAESTDYARLSELKKAYLTDYARTRGTLYWVEGTVDEDPTVRYFAPYLNRPRVSSSTLCEGIFIDFDGTTKYVYISTYFGVRPCVNIMTTRDQNSLEG